MDNNLLRKQFNQLFPVFDQYELKEFLLEEGHYLQLEKGDEIIDAGDYIEHIPLLINGSLKVFRQDNDGREVLVYYITPGQSCALTLMAGFRRQKSTIKAIAQESTELIAVPSHSIQSNYYKYPAWQKFVLETFNSKFNDLLEALESVVFNNLDERLHQYLLTRSRTLLSNELKISHQEIADDLVTSREVISRLLKQMESRQLVSLSRGKIMLL